MRMFHYNKKRITLPKKRAQNRGQWESVNSTGSMSLITSPHDFIVPILLFPYHLYIAFNIIKELINYWPSPTPIRP